MKVVNDSVEHLTVGVFVDPPWVNEEWENETEPGILIEVLQLVCQMIKVKCDLITAPVFGYGDYTNGSWHGMVKYIAENTFHLSFPGFTPTQQRYEVIDFSDYVYSVPLVLATRNSDPAGLSLWRFMAFHWSVWLCLLVSSAFVGMFLACIEMTRWNTKRYFTKSFVRCLDSFAIMSNQRTEIETIRISVRLLIAFWSLATLILGGVYSGHLLSFMIAFHNGLPFSDFQSFSDCIETKQCQLTAPSTSISYIQDIFTSTDTLLVRLNKSLTLNPLIIIPDQMEMFDSITQWKGPHLVAYVSHPEFMQLTNNNKNCYYSYVRSSFTDDMAFPLPKNFTMLKQKINFNLLQINSMGILGKIYNDYIGTEVDCNDKQIEGSKPLPFTSVVGLLFILACGGMFGLGGLICENIMFRCPLFYKKITFQ